MLIMPPRSMPRAQARAQVPRTALFFAGTSTSEHDSARHPRGHQVGRWLQIQCKIHLQKADYAHHPKDEVRRCRIVRLL